jgi:YjjG family noncanonical pyrimidine nucleotidase
MKPPTSYNTIFTHPTIRPSVRQKLEKDSGRHMQKQGNKFSRTHPTTLRLLRSLKVVGRREYQNVIRKYNQAEDDNMYKAIIFDLDNTLLNYSLSEVESMKRTLQDHKIFVNEEEKWHEFWKLFTKHNFTHWMDFVNNVGSHKSIEDVLISSFRDSLNLGDTQHEILTNTYWDYFCNTCLFEGGAEEVIHSLKNQYKLGIISNGISTAQRKRLAAGNIKDIFESIVVSDEVGIRKPRKEIFEISLSELKLSNHEVLFIGDSLNDDYHGARNAEIDFCFYNRNGISITNEYQPKYIVSQLQELLRVI